MIDWNNNTPYFSGMRKIAMIIIAGLFWGCPGSDPEPDQVVPLGDYTFIYLQNDNKLAFSIDTEPNFEGNPLSSVRVYWYGVDTTQIPDTIRLYDDGTNGDIIGTDDIWMRKISNSVSSELSHPVSSSDSGKVFITYYAQYNTLMKTVTDSFHLGNLKPYILNISVPDTIVRPSGNGFNLVQLNCKVSDANGLDDIKWVGFRSYHTVLDSFFNNGNYIYMYDDGGTIILYEPNIKSGDVTANDGIYSFQAPLSSASTAGIYDWIFEAQDFQFEYSDTITHRIVVQ
ncbi:MAG: hypothetical protein HQ509_04935 [Candidatus Marinimicrobia bacterium]|nr:hypothetical protein [Candidatus Neomarinimicrobiota bacterium]